MSKYINVTENGLIIECGFDRPMDYVFVQVIKGDDYLYSIFQLYAENSHRYNNRISFFQLEY